MKLIRKISLLLVTALLFGLMVFPAAAGYKESDEIIYEQAFELLNSLGISVSQQKDFSLDITRGEFCDMVARLINITDYEAPVCYYPDVVRTHTYAQAIYGLSKFGYVKGDTDGNFLPDSPITANQAAKAVVKALGYTEEMLGSDIYPTSYIMKAREIKLFNNVGASGEEALSRGEAFVFIENALNAPAAEMNGVQGGYVQYSVDKKGYAADTYHSLKKDTGIIDSNFLTTLSGSSKTSVGENRITIDGKAFNIKNKSYREYLGYNVEYYANDDDEILYLRPYNNNVCEIDYEDITEFNLNYVNYEVNNKTKKLSISKNVDFIYNGVAYPEFNPASFTNEYFDEHRGSFVFVDNDNDERYDCIFANEYVTYVVNYANDDTKTIYMKNYDDDSKRSVSFEDADYIELTRPDGLEIPFSVMLTNESASVFESKDGKYVKIIAAAIKANGTVKSLDDDGVLLMEHEDGTEGEYKLDSREKKTIDSLVPGFSGEFILNFKGEICGVTSFLGENYKYGFLVRVLEADKRYDNLEFKVLCADGKMRIFKVDEKTLIDAKKYTDLRELYAKLTKTDISTGSTYTRSQIIRYIDSSDNTYIKKIDTAELGENEEEVNSINVESYTGSSYRPSQMYCFGKMQFDVNDLVVFVVPRVASGPDSDINTATDKDYFVRYNLADWWKREYMDADAVIKDRDGGLANCVAAYYEYYRELPIGGNRLYFNTNPTIAMVDSVTYGASEDGEKVPIIKFVTTTLVESKQGANIECSQKKVYDADGKVVVGERATLKKGDVIIFYADTDGLIEYTEVVYDVSRTDNARFILPEYKSNVNVAGMAYSKSGKTLKMTSVVKPGAPAAYDKSNPIATFDISNDNLFTGVIPESTVKILVYDSKNETVRKGNMFDIQDYKNNPDATSLIYIRWSYGVPTTMCIFN